MAGTTETLSVSLPTRRWAECLGLTLLAILATELVSHGPVPAPEPIPAAMLITALVAVVYAGFRGGLLPGLVCAALLALFSVHLLVPHEALAQPADEALRTGGIMLVIGAVMAGAAAALRRRDERLRADLVAKAEDLQRANKELRRANQTLEAFTFVVGHDLKEPVRAIENYLSEAEAEYGTEEGREFVVRAHQANRRMAGLLQGLLAYGRASTPGDPVDLSVKEILLESGHRAQFETMLLERGGTLEVDPELPRVRGNEMALAQGLGNLVLNGLRHNPKPSPRVFIRAGPSDEERVAIDVDDDGPGFPPEVLRRFEREHGAPSTVKGGFGLLIAQRAVQAMGGRMELGRSPEGGARVRIVLPRAREASDPPAAGASSTAPPMRRADRA